MIHAWDWARVVSATTLAVGFPRTLHDSCVCSGPPGQDRVNPSTRWQLHPYFCERMNHLGRLQLSRKAASVDSLAMPVASLPSTKRTRSSCWPGVPASRS
jgi:hypothetical protein